MNVKILAFRGIEYKGAKICLSSKNKFHHIGVRAVLSNLMVCGRLCLLT